MHQVLSMSASNWNGIFEYDNINKMVTFTINFGSVVNGATLFTYANDVSYFKPTIVKEFYGITVGTSVNDVNRFNVIFHPDGRVICNAIDLNNDICFATISGKYSVNS